MNRLYKFRKILFFLDLSFIFLMLMYKPSSTMKKIEIVPEITPSTYKTLKQKEEDNQTKYLTQNMYYDESVLQELKEKAEKQHHDNQDIIGIMYIEGYLMEYIAYTPDHLLKYLYLDENQNQLKAGTPFLSTHGDGTFNGNALIYGHYMMNGDKFGTLMMSVTDQNILNKFPPLVVYDTREDRFHFYQLESKFPIVDGVEFVTLSKFESDRQRGIYNQTLIEKSFFHNNPTPEILEKNHLFLQTCTNAEGDYRTVFSFYEIESGELIDEE